MGHVTSARAYHSAMVNRALPAVLIVLNLVVLLGQIWPDGAPPFARAVNIVFLVLNLAFLFARGQGKLFHEDR